MSITRHGVGARMSQAVVHAGTAYLAGQVAEKVYVIETGRIRWHGAMADFLADADLQRTYLWV